MAQPSIQSPSPAAMAQPKDHYLSPRPVSASSLDPSRYHASMRVNCFFRRRYLLALLAVTVLVVMGIGIVFVAHAYYHQWGGQGFLKARDALTIMHNDVPRLFLPMRELRTERNALKVEDDSLLADLPWNVRALGSGSNIPYYTCGDQANSCAAYDQPNICCPVGLSCYKATFTVSGIFCCNSTVSEWSCEHPKQNTPKCLTSMVECSAATGGGCCPSVLECSPNGCIHVNPASTISASSGKLSASEVSSSPSESKVASSATLNSISATRTPITITNYITIAPAATVTLAKSGEVADAGSGAEISLMTRMYLPYSFGCALFGIALLMGMM